MSLFRRAVILIAAALAAAPAVAGDVTVGSLTVSRAFTRATPPGASVAGGYFIVENKGATPDRLVSLATDLSPKAEIHEMKMDGSTMIMRPVVGGLEIPAGGKVELKPGGYHVMFVGIKQQLAAGQTVKATLTFEKAGAVQLDLPVEALGARGPSAAGHTGH